MKSPKSKKHEAATVEQDARTQQDSTKAETPATIFRILKIGTCPSVSGKSTLTYHVGCIADDDSEIQFRVYTNSANGFFSPEWVSLSAIEEALEKRPTNKPITSFLLHSLFRGKSVNTPAFLLAALKNEGLLSLAEGKRRSYQRTDSLKFITEINQLMSSQIDLKVEEKGGNGDTKTKGASTGKKGTSPEQFNPAQFSPT